MWSYEARTGPVRPTYGTHMGCLLSLNPCGARKVLMHLLKLYGPRTGKERAPCDGCTIILYQCIGPWECDVTVSSWWRHEMETFSALLALCAGNSPVTGEFPAQRPMIRSFDIFFNLRLNKRLSKQSLWWWFETPSRSSCSQCNTDSDLQVLLWVWWEIFTRRRTATLEKRVLNECFFLTPFC